MRRLGGEISGAGLALVIQNGALYKVSAFYPYTRTQLGNAIWGGASSMATDRVYGHPIYVISDQKLWSVNPIDGTATHAPGRAGTVNWLGDTRMCSAIGGTSATGGFGDLIVAETGHLWRVTPSDGTLVDLGTGWAGTTSIGGSHWFGIYAIQANQLWYVNPRTGAYSSLGSGWGGPTQMATADNGIFVAQTQTLWSVNADTGGYSALGRAFPQAVTSLAELPVGAVLQADGGYNDGQELFFIEAGMMWRGNIEGFSGFIPISDAIWPRPTLMVGQYKF